MTEEEAICIGQDNGVTTNIYRTYKGTPVVEVLVRGHRIALALAQAESLIDMLGEAMAFAAEEWRS